MSNKFHKLLEEFKRAPLPIQNSVIKKGIVVLLFMIIVFFICRFTWSLSGVMPAMLLLIYLVYDFLRTFHIACTEKYTLISGECLQIVEKKQISGFLSRNPKISHIRIRYDRSKELSIQIRNQKEIEDIEEGKSVEVYIPDHARVYQDGQGYRISEYFCILTSSQVRVPSWELG